MPQWAPFMDFETSSIKYPILFLLSITLYYKPLDQDKTRQDNRIKMSGQGDGNITEDRRIVPSSPFEIQATQDLLQKRIENGMSPSYHTYMNNNLTR
jgi:hypothetical protein